MQLTSDPGELAVPNVVTVRDLVSLDALMANETVFSFDASAALALRLYPGIPMLFRTMSTGSLPPGLTEVIGAGVGRPRRRRLLAAAAISVVLAACGMASPDDNSERRAAAREIAVSFLAGLTDPAVADRGWSLIHPATREDWGGAAQYMRIVAESDLSLFEYSVGDVTRCDDGLTCFVCISLPNGTESVPAFLVSTGRPFDGLVPYDAPTPCGDGIADARLGVGLDLHLNGPRRGVFLGRH